MSHSYWPPFIKSFLQSSDLFLKQWSLVNLLPLKRFFCPYNKKIRHMSNSRQIRNSPLDWKLPLWMGMRVIGASDVFFIAIVCFVNLNHILLHVRTLFFGFTHCDEWLKEFGLCAPVKQEVMAGQFQATWCAKKCKYEWKYPSERQCFTLKAANNCGQRVLENIYFIMWFSPTFNRLCL